MITTFLESLHGVHKTKLLSINECENPSLPKCKTDVIEAKFETYRKNDEKFLNISMNLKKNIVAFVNFRSGTEVNGKVKNYKLFFTKLTCKNIIAKFILTTMNVTYNGDTCEISKGNYHITGFDINKVDHAMNFVPIREPGINNWYSAFYGNDCTYICIIMRVEIIVFKNKTRQII